MCISRGIEIRRFRCVHLVFTGSVRSPEDGGALATGPGTVKRTSVNGFDE
jgi:hypothetical protein